MTWKMMDAIPKSIRRVSLGYDARREPKTDRFCVRCQRDIRPDQQARIVRLVSDEPMVLHPEDAGSYGEDWLIGDDCARTIGWEFTRPEHKETE